MTRPFTLQIANLHSEAEAQAILYATDGADHAERNVLAVKLVNGGGELVLRRADAGGAPSVQIGLTGLVPPERVDALSVHSQRSVLRQVREVAAGHARFDFFAQEDIRVAPGEALAFEVRQIAIPPTFHRSRRVFVTASWNGIADSRLPAAGSLVERVHLVETPGSRRDPLPLEVVAAGGCGGGVAVDTSRGAPRDLDNRFTFYLRNTSAQAIAAPADPPARPRIFISFATVEKQDAPGAGNAVCTAADARAIQLDFDVARAPADYVPRWRLARNEQELLWELAPLSGELFRAGEALAITASGLVTRLPPGLSALTVRCEGFPGYRDTRLHLDVEKVVPRARIEHVAGGGTVAMRDQAVLEWRTRGGAGPVPVHLAMVAGATGAPPRYGPQPPDGKMVLDVPPSGATWQVVVQGQDSQDAMLVPVDVATLGLQAVFYVDRGAIWRLPANGDPVEVRKFIPQRPTDLVLVENATRLALAANGEFFTCALDGHKATGGGAGMCLSIVETADNGMSMRSALWAGRKRPDAQWPSGSENDEPGTGDTCGLALKEPLAYRHDSDPAVMTWIRSPIQMRRAPPGFYLDLLVAGTSGIGGRFASPLAVNNGYPEVRFEATHGDVAGFAVDAPRRLLYWIDARARRLKRYWLDPTVPAPVNASLFFRRRVMLPAAIPAGPGLPAEGPFSELYTIPGTPEVLCEAVTKKPANLFAAPNGDVYWLETPDGGPSYLRRWVRALEKPELVYRFAGALDSALMAGLA